MRALLNRLTIIGLSVLAALLLSSCVAVSRTPPLSDNSQSPEALYHGVAFTTGTFKRAHRTIGAVQMTQEGFLSNDAGGTLGGISSGQPIVAHVAFKPTSSIRAPGRTVDLEGHDTTVVTKGRHDPCVGIRGTPIVEAMLALVLMDHLLRHRAQNLDVQQRTPIIPPGFGGNVMP